jgi:hypothetical protein
VSELERGRRAGNHARIAATVDAGEAPRAVAFKLHQ